MAVLPGFLPLPVTLPHGLTLTALYVVVATAIHAGIVLAAGTARDWLTVSGRAVLVRRALSLTLVGVAAWVAWQTR